MLPRLDPVQLAWAAGFFDGEGSTIVYESRPGYLRLVVSVPQSGGAHAPDVLKHFERAVLGLGEIVPLNADGMWHWRGRNAEEVLAVLALIWGQLGRVKREQAIRAVRRFRTQYGPGRLKARPPRRRRQAHADHATTAPLRSREMLDRAWVAGFMDGEGCFGLVRSAGARKSGPAWHRIRASATQRSDLAGPPDVLFRLVRVLGVGRIERHGGPHAYKWVVEGAERIEDVLRKTGQWLGQNKTEQAVAALVAFAAQHRLKGNATNCVRGHPYTHVVIRNGRRKQKCNACARILQRMKRASEGVAPRKFKNVARRYNC